MRSGEEAGRLVAGTRQVLRLIASGGACKVLLALDADPRMRETLRQAAQGAGVPVEDCESMALLGKLCRIAVPCAAAARTKAPDLGAQS
jgi:ribosomal protein L7Ae-like RNA K-turn-binding protein